MYDPKTSKTVRHIVDLQASPERVYRALMDPREHAAFTGMRAKIAKRVGGAFTTCGERNYGYNVALQPGSLIVQAWTHRDWPQGAYSIATFALKAVARGTRLTFTQIGVPSACFRWIDGGWKSTYWEPLSEYLAQPQRSK